MPVCLVITLMENIDNHCNAESKSEPLTYIHITVNISQVLLTETLQRMQNSLKFSIF